MAFVHSPLSERSGEVEEGLVYITDWMATILSAAKIKVPQHLDSENLWPLLSEGGNSPRSEIILSLDQVKIEYHHYNMFDIVILILTSYKGPRGGYVDCRAEER